MKTLYQRIAARSITCGGVVACCATVLVLFFIYSFAVVFTLNFRPLYYAYISATGWHDSVGIPMPEIIANYKALIQYNSVFSVAPLDLPTLGLSANGRIHYEEVKRIFAVFQIVLIASVAGLVPLIVHLLRLGKVKFLKMGGMVSAILAIAILLYLGLDWKRFFVRFHETLFDNDFWIFDAAVDPSILILPNGYFMVCAVMIFALIFGLSATAVLLSRSLSRRNAILQGR